MTRGSQVLCDRRGAKDRHEAVYQVIASAPGPVDTKSVHMRLRTRMTLRQVRVAVERLRIAGRLEVVGQSHGGRTSNTYRCAAERKVANG